MGGTHHHGQHHSRHHRGTYAPHRQPRLPHLASAPQRYQELTEETQFTEFYKWTEAPVKLQVVDKVGVPIYEAFVTRDTTIAQVRQEVTEAVRRRHFDVLNGPRHSEGGGHRTYTVIADVHIYKISNYADALSGKLRELEQGSRLDGETRKTAPIEVLEHWKHLAERTKCIKAKAGMERRLRVVRRGLSGYLTREFEPIGISIVADPDGIVKVKEVKPESAAGRAGILADDILRSVGGIKICADPDIQAAVSVLERLPEVFDVELSRKHLSSIPVEQGVESPSNSKLVTEEWQRLDEYNDIGRYLLGRTSRLRTSQPTKEGGTPALVEYWKTIAETPASVALPKLKIDAKLETKGECKADKGYPSSIEDVKNDPRIYCPLHPSSVISKPGCCVIFPCGPTIQQCHECRALELKWKKTPTLPAKLGFLLAAPPAPQEEPTNANLIEGTPAEAKFPVLAEVLPPDGDELQEEHKYDDQSQHEFANICQEFTEEQLALASELAADWSEAAQAIDDGSPLFAPNVRPSKDAVGVSGHEARGRVIKLLYKADLQSAKSYSSRHKSWTEHWKSPSWTSAESSSSGWSGGGGGGSCGGGSG